MLVLILYETKLPKLNVQKKKNMFIIVTGTLYLASIYAVFLVQFEKTKNKKNQAVFASLRREVKHYLF